MIKLSKQASLIVLFLSIVLISLFFGFRDVTVGYDSYVYAINFSQYENKYYDFEPFFVLISNLIRSFTNNYSIYFTILCGLIFSNYFYLNSLIYKEIKPIRGQFIILLAFMMSSTWILTISTNAIRQGIALSFLYIFLWLFVRKKYFLSIIFLILSIFSHNSIYLIFLTLILLLIKKENVFFSIVLILSIFYPLGINELLILSFSEITGLDIYNQVKNYELDAEAWVGFQPFFYIYTLFWFFLFLFFYKIYFNNTNYFNLLKIFSILMLVYFIFGFGGYSNRYAFFVWAFLPIIQAYTVHMFILKYSNLNKYFILIAIFSFFFVSSLAMIFNLGYI